ARPCWPIEVVTRLRETGEGRRQFPLRAHLLRGRGASHSYGNAPGSPSPSGSLRHNATISSRWLHPRVYVPFSSASMSGADIALRLNMLRPASPVGARSRAPHTHQVKRGGRGRLGADKGKHFWHDRDT